MKRRAFFKFLAGLPLASLLPARRAACAPRTVEEMRLAWEGLFPEACHMPPFCAKFDPDTSMWEFYELGRGPAGPDTWCGSVSEEYLVEAGSTVERELRILAGRV